jgi:hypothetical protein
MFKRDGGGGAREAREDLVVFAEAGAKAFSEFWLDSWIEWVVVNQFEMEAAVAFLDTTLLQSEPDHFAVVVFTAAAHHAAVLHGGNCYGTFGADSSPRVGLDHISVEWILGARGKELDICNLKAICGAVFELVNSRINTYIVSSLLGKQFKLLDSSGVFQGVVHFCKRKIGYKLCQLGPFSQLSTYSSPLPCARSRLGPRS